MAKTLEQLIYRLELILRQSAWFEKQAPSLTKTQEHLEELFRNSVGKDDFSDAEEKVNPIYSLVGSRMLENIP